MQYQILLNCMKLKVLLLVSCPEYSDFACHIFNNVHSFNRKKRREPENEEHGLKIEPAILSVEVLFLECTTHACMFPRSLGGLVFNICMLFGFQGRGFNVQINYAEEPVQDYVQAAVSTILLINERVFYLLLR